MWWLLHPLSARGEGFYGGIGGDIAEYTVALSILAAVIAAYRRHNCHVNSCWRLCWHPHPDHGHPVCKHHHPDGDSDMLDARHHQRKES